MTIVKTPLVSVIIPCYNVELYVEQAVRSILSQSYTNLEIWLIDDASTDATIDEIQNFHDERIIVKRFETNTQKIGAVNEVLKLVQGKYITFQDADDWSEPEKIEKQVAEFERNPALGICFTNYHSKPFDKKELTKPAMTNLELKHEFLAFGTSKNISFVPTCCPTMMISKAALLSTGGYHNYFIGKVGEDIHWIYRILKVYEGITIDEPLYNYRSRKGSLTDLQFSGKNPKAAYTWKLLALIIAKDVNEHQDLLTAQHAASLKDAELQACEEQLGETIIRLNNTRDDYESSQSFRLGKFLLGPLQFFRNRKQKRL